MSLLQKTIFRVFPRWKYVSQASMNNAVMKFCSTVSNNEISNTTFYSETKLSENDVVNPEFTNRNPRNLEFLGLAKKRKGWKFQYPTRTYYHRLIFEASSSHISAYVQHCNGVVVISASTKELCIARHLYSTRDVSAAKNLGRVMALRCLQGGIVNMILKEQNPESSSTKFEMFREAVEGGGVDLFEPEEIQAEYKPGVNYDDEEEMKEMYDRQIRVFKLSKDHKMLKDLRKIRDYPGSVKRVPGKPLSLDNDNHRIKPF